MAPLCQVLKMSKEKNERTCPSFSLLATHVIMVMQCYLVLIKGDVDIAQPGLAHLPIVPGPEW